MTSLVIFVLIAFFAISFVIYKASAKSDTAKPDPRQMLNSKSPMVRDEMRRLVGGIDDSPTGRAIERTERVQKEITARIGTDQLNVNDSARAGGIHFLMGVAVAYAVLEGVGESVEDTRAVVRGSLRSWMRNVEGPDHFAENLAEYMEDSFAGSAMDLGGEAVMSDPLNMSAIVDAYRSGIPLWSTFDLDAHNQSLSENEQVVAGA